MGLLEEWDKVKRNENNSQARKWALNQGAPKTQNSYFPSSGGASRVYDDVVNKCVADHRATGANDYGFGPNVGSGTRQGNDDSPESTYSDGPKPPSLMEQ